MNKPQEGALETFGAVIALIVVFFAYLAFRRPRPDERPERRADVFHPQNL
jgi:hypothetical protein